MLLLQKMPALSSIFYTNSYQKDKDFFHKSDVQEF